MLPTGTVIVGTLSHQGLPPPFPMPKTVVGPDRFLLVSQFFPFRLSIHLSTLAACCMLSSDEAFLKCSPLDLSGTTLPNRFVGIVCPLQTTAV
jgi:hypothetical protein